MVISNFSYDLKDGLTFKNISENNSDLSCNIILMSFLLKCALVINK